MATLPYVLATGNISKALDGITSAATPPKVTQDFVKTVLQIPGGSGDAMTTFLKRLGFANSDGGITDIYREFRNRSSSGAAMAKAIRRGFSELYLRNEFCHLLPDEDLKGLIVEVTGNAPDSRTVQAAVSTFKNLKNYADFEAVQPDMSGLEPIPSVIAKERRQGETERNSDPKVGLGLNLGYTINLNLPATSDIKVFDAIFKSLKENLLQSHD